MFVSWVVTILAIMLDSPMFSTSKTIGDEVVDDDSELPNPLADARKLHIVIAHIVKRTVVKYRRIYRIIYSVTDSVNDNATVRLSVCDLAQLKRTNGSIT